jgi:hypothetical protein
MRVLKAAPAVRAAAEPELAVLELVVLELVARVLVVRVLVVRVLAAVELPGPRSRTWSG